MSRMMREYHVRFCEGLGVKFPAPTRQNFPPPDVAPPPSEPVQTSWLNAVEGFFAKLTRRRLKHGVFHSVVDLQAAINRFIAEHNNTEAKPFMWRADPDDIIAARNRGFQMLDSIH